jgi:RND family efflux transporter MFP subunit
LTGALLSGCSTAETRATETKRESIVSVSAVAAVERPIARFIRATGTLTAEEQADIAAETGGRIVAVAVERGTPVAAGAELVRVSAVEAEAQLREAEANAAQIEARLGLGDERTFEIEAVPEVQNARAAYELATSEFDRIKALLDDGVVSRSEFDQRRTQAEAARRQLDVAKNAAAQQFQSLQAARARVALAQKAVNDTVVRAPFAGTVAQRLVSAGDYVNRGTKVVQVVRTNPLRAQLTIPEQYVAAVGVGQSIAFEVDAYPGRQFAGTVRFISPAVQADQRALTIEAVVPNSEGTLKPGLFATARIDQPNPPAAVVVPTKAVLTANGTSRVFVVQGDHVEERIVSTGVSVGDGVEVTEGVKAGERVALTNVDKLADGMKVN